MEEDNFRTGFTKDF
jgi:hypothetical protein